jgi:ABC-type ATPase involved in cell division/GNAT superfamily N-acetyltransferase
MPSINLIVESEISRTARARQLEAMFDVPPATKCRLEWAGDIPIDANDWNIGLIVGPSGSGKSSIAKHVFGSDYHPALEWTGASVIDDFAARLSMQDISSACQAVGFNTIPAWLRPFSVLSTGERFRVDLARRVLELPDPVVVDEFSSVVDRQVAQIGSHAAQKFVRKHQRRFVAISCHYDIVDWLQPDWIFEPATMHFARRSLQRRPQLEITIGRVPYSAWRIFSPFHYLTADLHRAAQCFALFVGDRVAAFGGMLHRPHPKVRDVMGLSRLVTLPDWQGLGLAMILSDTLGSAYKAIGKRMHTYPAHPSLIRSYDHSAKWIMTKKPGIFSSLTGNQDPRFHGRVDMGGPPSKKTTREGGFGQRPCAVFEYCGDAMEKSDAVRLLAAAARATVAV